MRSVRILALSIFVTAALATLLQMFASNNATPAPGVHRYRDPTGSGRGRVDAGHVRRAGSRARGRGHRPARPCPAVAPATPRRGVARARDARDRPRRLGAGAGRPATTRPVPAPARGTTMRSPPTGRCSQTSSRTRSCAASRVRPRPSTLRDSAVAGSGGLALDLLAADYGLARFGGVTLSAREERRALARASTLRRQLLRR